VTAQVHPRHQRLLPVVALALLTWGTTWNPGDARADANPTKLGRQVGVMERLLNEMLVDSPNFLVAGQNVAAGFEVDDVGVIFTFRTSLTGLGWQLHKTNTFLNFWPFSSEKQRTIVIHKEKKDGDGDGAVIDLGDGKIVIKEGEVFIDQDGKVRKLSEKDSSNAVSDKEYREDQLKKYAAAKEELVRFLLDYGETLGALPAGQSVRIVVRLGDIDLPAGHEVHSLTLRARIDDLKALGDGRIEESAARSRIEIRES
jgi:hypothetical protein